MVYLTIYIWPVVGMFQSVSIWLVVVISIHRYIAVLHPLKHVRYSSKKIIYTHLLLVSIFSVVFELPRFFEMTTEDQVDPTTGKTYKIWVYTDMYYDSYYQLIYKDILTLTLKRYLPTALVAYYSVCVIRSVKKRNKVHASDSSHHRKYKEVEITTTI